VVFRLESQSEDEKVCDLLCAVEVLRQVVLVETVPRPNAEVVRSSHGKAIADQVVESPFALDAENFAVANQVVPVERTRPVRNEQALGRSRIGVPRAGTDRSPGNQMKSIRTSAGDLDVGTVVDDDTRANVERPVLLEEVGEPGRRGLSLSQRNKDVPLESTSPVFS